MLFVDTFYVPNLRIISTSSGPLAIPLNFQPMTQPSRWLAKLCKLETNKLQYVLLSSFDVYELMFSALASQVPPTTGLATRFLSRYDKSATNIKESEIFIKIGQVS